MSRPIAIFYHCVFLVGQPTLPLFGPRSIVAEQMATLMQIGLTKACNEFHVGCNGGIESKQYSDMVFPPKAMVTYHGLHYRNENGTIRMIEEWVKTHPDWYVFYFHSKGASSPLGTAKFYSNARWRHTMMQDLVLNWRMCVADLDAGHDVVCSHWKWNQCDGTQHIPAGNFIWFTSNFAAKLPSIMLRDRIKISGLEALESRYEAETYWGNGPRPNVKMFRQYPGDGIP